MEREWKEVSLGDVCKIRRGSSPRPIVDFLSETEGMPWVKIADATETNSRFIEKTNQFIKEEGVCKSVIVEKGDLILSNSGTAGLPKFMSITACIHDGWQVLKDLEGITSDYLYYSLLHIRLLLLHNANDSTMKNLTLDMVRDAKVHLPPLSEQKAIAHILGSLDDKIELNRRMNATLEGMAQALFKSWFVDFDPVIDNALAAGNPIPDELADRAEVRRQALADGSANREAAKHFPANFQQTNSMGWIPEGWEVSCFGDVAKCFDSKRIPLSKPQREAKKPGKIPYYGATSIMDYVNEWIFDDTYLLIGEDGSVIKEDGTPFVQYIWGKSWVNNHAHVLQGKSGISTEHLMLFMQSQNLTAYVTGAVQLKINQKNMNSIPFLKASDLVNLQFSEAVTRLYERIKLLSEENETLTNLRDALLPKLLSGELACPKSSLF